MYQLRKMQVLAYFLLKWYYSSSYTVEHGFFNSLKVLSVGDSQEEENPCG